mgnify:CR=1 FL=1
MTSQPGPEHGTTDVMDHRQRLVSVAYRQLCAVAEPEEPCREAFIRRCALTPASASLTVRSHRTPAEPWLRLPRMRCSSTGSR